MADPRLGGSSTEICDNLESTSILAALSANQGRVLKGYVDDLDERVTALESDSGSGSDSGTTTFTPATDDFIDALFT